MSHERALVLYRWRVLKWIAYGLAAVGGVMAMLLVVAIWMRGWSPVFDDGPFRGTARTDCPTRRPDQVFSIYGGNKLHVFDRAGNEPAPTVALRTGSNRLLWCIFATAETMDHARVHKLRFTAYRQFPFLTNPRVRGRVEWTFGAERMWWFISRDGTLNEYWYSW